MGTYYSPQYVPAYQIQWKNFTDTSTPLSAANLQKSHNAISNIDQAVNSAFNSMDLAKLDKETASSMVTGIDYNENTGTFVIHFFDSSKHPDLTFNTNLEKIIVNFVYNPNTQKLELTQSDGTQVEVNLSDFISNPDLVDSDEIQWTVNTTGQISAHIKNHSIGADKLQQSYLSTIIEQAENANESMVNAEYFSKLAKSYAVGNSNLQDRPTENVENAKYYYEETKKVAQGVTGQSNAFIGATEDEDGAIGLVTQPKAGDQDKVLQGDGKWGHRLQVDIIEQDGKYGYIQDGAFVPFKSQSDIDAAIRAAMTGTATAEDVLEGKTFTNAEEMGVTGVIPIRQSGQKVVNNRAWTYASRVYFGIDWGYYPKLTTNAGENTSSVFISYNKLRENLKITGDMVLKGVKFLDVTGTGETPTQEKTVTASREQQIVTPDDADTHLSQVTVEPFPDASGTYTYPVDSIGGTYDMGADNNLRYVNASNVYEKGKADATVPTQEKTVTPSTSAIAVTPDSGKHLTKVTVNAIPTQRGASGQAPGNKCWTYNNRVYFGIDYGWYPSGSSFGGMSNVCERYVDYANVASALGITASTVRAGSTVLGITGNNTSGTYTFASGSTGGTVDMGATNNLRYVNATNVYNKGKADGHADARSDFVIQTHVVNNGGNCHITIGWRKSSEDYHTIHDAFEFDANQGSDKYVAAQYHLRYNEPYIYV